MTFYYKIRDKNTGLFKNNNYRIRNTIYGISNPNDAQRLGFDTTGMLWDNYTTLASFMRKWASWPKGVTQAKKTKTTKPIPSNWEIVKYELVDVDTLSIEEFSQTNSK